MEAQDAIGSRRGRGDVDDGQGGRGGGHHGVGLDHPVQLREQRALELEVLRDGLHDDICLGESVQ